MLNNSQHTPFLTSAGDGYVSVPLSVLDHPGLSVSARMVWLRLRGHLNRKTGQCNPRQALLARELNVSIDTVQRATDQLRRVGVVAVRRHQHGCSYTFLKPQERGSETIPETANSGFSKPHFAVSEVSASLLTEPNELNQMNAAAAEVFTTPPERAAAAACTFVDGPKAKTEVADFSQNFPQGEKTARAIAEEIVAELMPLHPEPGNAPKAVAAAAKLLADAPETAPATIEALRASHALWRLRWAEFAPGRFIPQLWRWIAEGDWRVAPVERKGVKTETWQEKRSREKQEYDEKFYRELAEDEEWDVIRQYGGETAVEVWREKIKAIA